MKFKNVLLAALPVVMLNLVSCTNDDASDVVTETFNYTTPDTYAFEREGISTIDYSGQTSRLMMMEEIGNYIKNNASIGVDKAVLTDMYMNVNNRFSGAGLNESGKQLKDKTAASYDYFNLQYGGGSSAEQLNVRNLFEAQFESAKTASQGNAASAGVAGYYMDGTNKRLFDANGLEPQQVFLKGMMGACLLDQVCNNYLSVNKLNSSKENNTNKVFEAGKKYTTMEHAWDEAYGYIYGADAPTAATPVYKLWSSYINQVDADADFGTVREDIEMAFRKGRAAITANDYDARDKQIEIIKSKIALVSAVRAVFYLQEGKAKLVTDNGAKAFHALSEGYGFIMSLRYTNKPGTNAPYMSKAEVDEILSTLTAGNNGLWDVDYLNGKIDVLSAQIATRFGFTVAQASTVNK